MLSVQSLITSHAPRRASDAKAAYLKQDEKNKKKYVIEKKILDHDKKTKSLIKILDHTKKQKNGTKTIYP